MLHIGCDLQSQQGSQGVVALCRNAVRTSAEWVCQCFVRHSMFHALCPMLLWRPRPSGLPRLAQVIGPHAARRWLAETARALGLRYRFMACREFDALASPEREEVLRALGACSLRCYSGACLNYQAVCSFMLSLRRVAVCLSIRAVCSIRCRIEFLAHTHTVACGRCVAWSFCGQEPISR